MLLMLVDVADPRYGGSPDPDDEREERWRPIDKHISIPFLLALFAIGGAANTTSVAVAAPLTLIACVLTFVGARYALAEAPAKDAGGPREPTNRDDDRPTAG